MRAKVVEAESLVPQAMADAFRSGNLGVMDYVRMKNVQADTSMRESIAGGEKPRTEGTWFVEGLLRRSGQRSHVMLREAENLRLRSYGLWEEIDQRFFASAQNDNISWHRFNVSTFQRFNVSTST